MPELNVSETDSSDSKKESELTGFYIIRYVKTMSCKAHEKLNYKLSSFS